MSEGGQGNYFSASSTSNLTFGQILHVCVPCVNTLLLLFTGIFTYHDGCIGERSMPVTSAIG